MPQFSTLYATVLAALKKVEPTATFNVTHKTLSLGDALTPTGWFASQYSVGATIEMIILSKASQQFLTGTGEYVRTDALGLTLTAVSDGDKIIDANGLKYKVTGVRPHPIGNLNVTYAVDLTYLPLEA